MNRPLRLIIETAEMKEPLVIVLLMFAGVRDRIKFDLYLWMFPTFLEHMSLAIVDLTPLYQSQWTVMELQVGPFTALRADVTHRSFLVYLWACRTEWVSSCVATGAAGCEGFQRTAPAPRQKHDAQIRQRQKATFHAEMWRKVSGAGTKESGVSLNRPQ